MAIMAAVGCAEEKWMIDTVYAASEVHDNIAIAVYLTYRALCPFKRSERVIGCTGCSIVS